MRWMVLQSFQILVWTGQYESESSSPDLLTSRQEPWTRWFWPGPAILFQPPRWCLKQYGRSLTTNSAHLGFGVGQWAEISVNDCQCKLLEVPRSWLEQHIFHAERSPLRLNMLPNGEVLCNELQLIGSYAVERQYKGWGALLVVRHLRSNSFPG